MATNLGEGNERAGMGKRRCYFIQRRRLCGPSILRTGRYRQNTGIFRLENSHCAPTKLAGRFTGFSETRTTEFIFRYKCRVHGLNGKPLYSL